MRQRSIGIEAADGAEAGRDEVRLAGTGGGDQFVDLQLVEHLALLQACLEIGKEFAQGGAVLRHGFARVGDVGGRFHALEQRTGIDGFDELHAGGLPGGSRSIRRTCCI